MFEQWSINNVSIKYFPVIRVRHMREKNEIWYEAVPWGALLTPTIFCLDRGLKKAPILETHLVLYISGDAFKCLKAFNLLLLGLYKWVQILQPKTEMPKMSFGGIGQDSYELVMSFWQKGVSNRFLVWITNNVLYIYTVAPSLLVSVPKKFSNTDSSVYPKRKVGTFRVNHWQITRAESSPKVSILLVSILPRCESVCHSNSPFLLSWQLKIPAWWFEVNITDWQAFHCISKHCDPSVRNNP